MLQTEQQKIAHLLRRFGFGASEAEVAYYGTNGLNGAIEKLLNYDQVDEGFAVDPTALAVGKNNQKLRIETLQDWWIARMMTTRRPLQEKMTLFWHDHFATSTDKVSSPYMMLAQNDILRKSATGRFHDLLLNVSKDPAMLLWLDNQYNVKGHPNENFAREVMELFTLGIGHYSEQDVLESARAYTGWGFGTPGARRRQPKGGKLAQRQIFKDTTEDHDTNPKSFLGNRGNFDGDDAIAILCGNPRTSRYLTWKLWEWFAYSNPDPALIERLAEPFYRSGLDVKLLLRAIMQAPEFYSEKADRTVYKNPVDFTIATLRQLGFGAQALTTDTFLSDFKPATAARISTKGMGMALMYPPDVAGWDGGPAWVSSATMVERIKWAQTLFDQAEVGLKNQKFTIGCDAWALFQRDPTPEAAARRLVSVFDAEMRADKIPNLVAAARQASGGRVTPGNANVTAAAVSRLIFASPEFQFA